ncbi:MAG TPA: DUF4271 domain-containing protein [Flavobacteriales bacterium]|nr:DUF4271 domain-containing protein [Flavobacteriales bacterium]
MSTGMAADPLRATDPLSAEWVTVLLLGLFVLLALINAGGSRKWRLLGQTVFRMRLGRQAMREELDLQDRSILGMLVLSIGVIGLFAWQYFQWTRMPGAPSYMMVLGVAVAVVLAQGLLLRVVGGLFKVDQGVAEHLYTGLLLVVLAGVALLPVVVLMAYRAEYRGTLAPLGLAVVGTLLIYRWVRGTWIGVGEGVPVRYIILYFCAAEILPVLLAISALRPSADLSVHP